jgi:hypothetical protein
LAKVVVEMGWWRRLVDGMAERAEYLAKEVVES